MYYNKFTGQLVLDILDYFLISSFITSNLASYLKDYLAEKASMARLKKDLIKKSRLIEPLKSRKKLNSKESKIKKIYRFVLGPRGGSDYDYQLANKIKDLVIELAVFLKKKELQGKVLKLIFSHGRLVLQLILATYDINLQLVVLDPISREVVAIACCTGGAMGFIVSWFSVAATLVAPPTILSVFLVRSLAQQIQHNKEYTKIGRFLNDENFQENIKSIFIDAQKRIDNSNKIKLEHLNWNKNPAIKEAAERLGIFENAPRATGQFTLDTLDPDLNKILKEFGLSETLNTKTRIKRIKGKTINFRDFVEGMVDGDNKSDLDVIDVEIVQETVRIRIRD